MVAAGFGAYWFQPWKLFTSSTVDEAVPTATAGPETSPAAASEPQVVAQGTLITHEHDTTGTVKLLRLANDSLVVRLEDLETSDGPQLHVLLTDAPVIEGRDGWHVFDDGRHIDLGPLKGTHGNSNYPVPADTDVSRLDSVSIWCDRFDVSFGAAKLTPPPGG